MNSKDGRYVTDLTNIIRYIRAVKEHSAKNFFKNLWTFELNLKRKNPAATAKVALQRHRKNLKDKLNRISEKCSRVANHLGSLTPKEDKYTQLESQPLYKVVLDLNLGGQVYEFTATSPPFTKSPDTYNKDWQTTFIKLSKRHTTKSLIINECRIDSTIVGYLTKHLSLTLQEVWLGNNIIGDEGACLIAKALRQLFLLSLATNRITDRGALAIATWASPKLQILKLQRNQVGQYGVIAITVNLTKLKRLEVWTDNRPSTGNLIGQNLVGVDCTVVL